MSTQGLREGDVYRYTPVSHHCREGIFIVREAGGELRRYDTFWGSNQTVVRDSDIQTESGAPEFYFNLNDGWEPIERSDRSVYDPSDVRVISGQHGLESTRYRRVGSEHSARIEARNLESKLAEVRREKESLKWREEHLLREIRLAHQKYQGGTR